MAIPISKSSSVFIDDMMPDGTYRWVSRGIYGAQVVGTIALLNGNRNIFTDCDWHVNSDNFDLLISRLKIDTDV